MVAGLQPAAVNNNKNEPIQTKKDDDDDDDKKSRRRRRRRRRRKIARKCGKNAAEAKKMAFAAFFYGAPPAENFGAPYCEYARKLSRNYPSKQERQNIGNAPAFLSEAARGRRWHAGECRYMPRPTDSADTNLRGGKAGAYRRGGRF